MAEEVEKQAGIALARDESKIARQQCSLKLARNAA